MATQAHQPGPEPVGIQNTTSGGSELSSCAIRRPNTVAGKCEAGMRWRGNTNKSHRSLSASLSPRSLGCEDACGLFVLRPIWAAWRSAGR